MFCPTVVRELFFHPETNFSEIYARGETCVRSLQISSNSQNKCTSNYLWKKKQ